MVIRLRALGALSIDADSAPAAAELIAQPKTIALLSVLALARPRGFQQRDRIVGMFWPELDQQRARSALRKTLHRLRQSVGADVIIARGNEALAIADGTIDCDALNFDAALGDGRFGEAIECYTGELLPGFFVAGSSGFEDWLEHERAYYSQRAVDAAWKLVERFSSENLLTNATQLARRIARLTTTDERMLRRVVTMLTKLGDHAGAIDICTKFVDRLWRDYQTKPSPETLELIEDIRRGERR